MSQTLTPANLEWQDDTPFSSQFDDIYFSKQSGIDESHYNFIAHNHLEQRFAKLDEDHFVIGETGFGSGLNFFLAAKLWLESQAHNDKRLIFISAEKHPLSRRDLIQAHRLWPELAVFAHALQRAYPPLVKGLHCLDLFQGRVRLLLGFGDVLEVFEQLQLNPLTKHFPNLKTHRSQLVDAWFLDGFAPSKNPDMWQTALFQQLAQLSHHGTSFATFTSAGIVRKGLQSAGFKVAKDKGFGRKREMCFGHFQGLPSSAYPPARANHSNSADIGPLWPLSPALLQARTKPQSVVIIGAGLAGAITAYQLSLQGFSVVVIERNSQVAAEASGNPQGVLYNKLSAKDGKMAEFNLHSYLYALNFYRQLFDQGLLERSIDGDFCGVLQLAYNNKEAELQQQLKDKFAHCDDLVAFVDAEQASRLAASKIAHPALWFANSGWLSPPNIAAKLLAQADIQVIQDEITQLQPQADQSWLLIGRQTHRAEQLIICNSHQANQIQDLIQLPLQKIRGQISRAHSATAELDTVVCHQGYICPGLEQQTHKDFCFGASFKLKDPSLALRREEQTENQTKLAKHLPELAAQLELEQQPLSGRAAYRCASNDYLPFVGPLAKLEALSKNYHLWSKNSRAFIPVLSPYWPGLYINVAHGSKGLTSIPLSSAIVCALIQQQPLPIGSQLYPYLHPNRATIKNIIRGKTN